MSSTENLSAERRDSTLNLKFALTPLDAQITTARYDQINVRLIIEPASPNGWTDISAFWNQQQIGSDRIALSRSESTIALR